MAGAGAAVTDRAELKPVTRGREKKPVVVIYHRPIDEPFHGTSGLFRGFAHILEESVPVEVVCPPLPLGARATQPDRSQGLFITFRHMVRLAPRLIGAFLSDSSERSSPRSRVIIAFGAVVAGPAMLWAWLRGSHFVYYPQDYTVGVGREWRETGQTGGRLFSWIIWPLEKLTLKKAEIVLVYNDALRDDLRHEGVAESRLRVYSIPRELPVFDPSNVERWRDRLNLRGRVGLVFVGTFAYPPNVRAFDFIRTKLAPQLQEKAPEATVLVAGWGSDAYSVGLPPNMRVLGGVDDLDGLLFASSVGIAPMETTGGRSTKIVDYALHGLTVVATPGAARGMPESPNIQVADLDGFVDAVCRAVRRQPRDAQLTERRAPDPVYVDHNRQFESAGLGLELRQLLEGTHSEH